MLAPRLVKPLASRGRPPGRPPRRLARPARPRELAAQPGPHGLDRRGADDRPRAGHRRRDARRRPARLDRDGRQEAGQGRLRRHRQGRRRLVHRRLRRGLRLRRGRQGSSPACARTPARWPATSRPSPASTRRRSTTSTRYKWVKGSLAGLDDGGALVTKGFADQHDLKVGSALVVQSSTRQEARPARGRHPRAAGDGLAARQRRDRPEGVRRRLRPPAERVHVRGRQLARPALAQGDRRPIRTRSSRRRRSSSRAARTA